MPMLQQALIVIPVLLALEGPTCASAENAPYATHNTQHSEQNVRQLPTIAEVQIQARKDVETLEATLQADQKALERLWKEEAVLRQAAVAQSGSWIEPIELWKRKEALKQSIKHKQHALEIARKYAKLAENHFRATTERNWSRSHQPSWFGHWWKW